MIVAAVVGEAARVLEMGGWMKERGERRRARAVAAGVHTCVYVREREGMSGEAAAGE